MTTIYVVFGEDGEYSDWNTWPVKAFSSEEAADKFEMECQKFVKSKADKINQWLKDNPYPNNVELFRSNPNAHFSEAREWSNRLTEEENKLNADNPDKTIEASRHYVQYSTKPVELE